MNVTLFSYAQTKMPSAASRDCSKWMWSRSCSPVVKRSYRERLLRTSFHCVQWSITAVNPWPIWFYLKELAQLPRGAGCDQCRQTGYQGRAAIYEICLVTEPLRKLIMRKCDGGELKQCAIAEGMETLRQDGWRRVAQGKTTIEEVVRVTQTDEVMAETTEEAEPVMAAESADLR